ncbi:MAG: DNA methylase [Chloroflexi bacterium GWB2_49_20]|nr:MAG: DNA methylase [Chloroflexi bacterium GWB2_49_20]OGN79389.1 MAG: DNA methylase [Chloroflexi bacterium GWC2_49_37]OGN82841.1 MAG: DNA methylase [Chloroflexi bacterium GWD2_49_16]HCC78491.1 site-specific DNA-methyltransferase [Anaerolineae bacterium]HCM97316.1 site-specific DNA-methyltransferase [Anaerolineae bacterium]
MRDENNINEIFNRDIINTIKFGNAVDVLKEIPSSSVNCIITSPPYYKQRDYSTAVQIGNEANVEEYINNLTEVFVECKRILKQDGTFWLNLGDKYIDNELLGMPWRVAIAQINSKWILRSDIIWHKPNAMPSPVKNRPTIDHEYIFLFVKSKEYFYNADAVREPYITFSDKSRMKGGRNHLGKANGTPENGKFAGVTNLHSGNWDKIFNPLGRNRRTVWEIPLSKSRDSHFAVFPEKLVEICILAGCPENGIVLDPFIGSGTTAVVANKLGRYYIGIDSNPEYCEMAKKRLIQGSLL